MSNLTLLYPVHTLENQVLLSAGSELTEETMGALISSNSAAAYQECSLLQFSSVREDILNFITLPPYDVIFSDRKQASNMLKLIGDVHLVLPVLQSLDFFKRHDFYTYRHILVVFALSTLLAQDLVSDYQDQVKEIAIGPTHDIGKACVPLNILRKSSPLTRTELNTLEHHSIAGYTLLGYYLRDAKSLSAAVARDHHERKNGSGYPRGIALDDVFVEIISVCDIFDALISPRPYRPVAYDNRTAFEEITGMAERNEIGWDMVRALIARSRKDKPHYSECKISAEKRGSPPPGNVYRLIADKEDQTPDSE